MQKLVLTLILFVILPGPWFGTSTHANKPMFRHITVYINGVRLHIEIADTYGKRILGLSDREFLKAEYGMLFIYNTSKMLNFTMKETVFPLSIAFMNEDYVIEEIIAMKPLNRQQYQSSKPAMYALEVNQGWFKKHAIQPGHKLTFEN